MTNADFKRKMVLLGMILVVCTLLGESGGRVHFIVYVETSVDRLAHTSA